MNRSKWLQGCAPLLAAFMSLVVSADTIYVSPHGSDSNTGKGGWANAVATIGNGVVLAAINDTVLVSNGVYVLTEQVTINKTGLNFRDVTTPFWTATIPRQSIAALCWRQTV